MNSTGALTAGIVVEGLVAVLTGTPHRIVDGLSFAVAPGEVLGLVGESGAGKTTAALAVLGHARRGVRVTEGSVRVGGVDLLSAPEAALAGLRGRLVSYVPQDPAAALNPGLRVGTQIREVLTAHTDLTPSERDLRLGETLADVSLPDDDAFLRRFPHELSGGEQQRVCLAMAFVARPSAVVLDEPTTGLDATTQAHVLATVRRITAHRGVAAVYISHDLAVIAEIAHQVAVMYAGRLVELGPTGTLFRASAHPYTRALIAAIPELTSGHAVVGLAGHTPEPRLRQPGCGFAPRCPMVVAACAPETPELSAVGPDHQVRCIRSADVLRSAAAAGTPTRAAAVPSGRETALALQHVSAQHGSRLVVSDVTLDVAAGECVALVGESGSGKTTLVRAIAGLHPSHRGDILLAGRPLAPTARKRPVGVRGHLQYVFQSPYGSLNPRRTVGQAVGRPLEIFRLARGRDVSRQTASMLERVGISPSLAARYPGELSGGERQRVAIARALICRPQVLICDEVTSALDVSVQASIVELLAGLQRDTGLALLFLTHNLPLVASIAGRVAVMHRGRIVECGPVAQVLHAPHEDYTRRLLAAAPTANAARSRSGPG